MARFAIDFGDMVPWGEDPTENMVRLYLCPDIAEGTEDLLRKALGRLWKTTGPTTEAEDETPTTEYTLSPSILHSEGPDESVRGIQTWSLEPEGGSKYISRLEINPVFITSINDRTVVPNYRIPVRVFSDRENVKGDKFWNEFFRGGKFGQEMFDDLMNEDRIFYDQVFTLPMPFSMMETKLFDLTGYGTKDTPSAVYQIKAHYHNYNEDVQRYQDWSSERSELLIPNIYSYYGASTYGSEAGFIDPMWDDLIDWDPSGMLSEVKNLPKIYHDNVLYYLLPGAMAGENGYKDTYSEWVGAFPYHIHSSSIEDSIQTMYKNIMFTEDNMISLDGSNAMSLETLNSTPKTTLRHPYEINIRFPRHENVHTKSEDEAEDPKYWNVHDLSVTDGLPLRDILENNSASGKFMEMLKDLDDESLSGLKYAEKTFIVQTKHGLSETPGEIQTEVRNTKIKSFDYLQFLGYLYNNYAEALNENYFFPTYEFAAEHWLNAGEVHQWRAGTFGSTYFDNTLDRYADSIRILRTMEHTFDYLRDYIELGTNEVIPEASFVATFDAELGADWEEKLSQHTDQTENILRHLLAPQNKKIEVLGYKIEKFEGSPVEGSSELLNLQNFWFFNATEASPFIEYKDTQVKYGKEYTYDCYAYVAVTGHKYRYRDFRLTKMIGTIDENLDGVPEYYCVRFYDPKTMEPADQLFATEFSLTGMSYVGSNIGDVREIYSESPRYTALSQRNEFATKNVDLSRSPNIADFYIDIEPCIKILKVPMFSKSLGVYDSPGNAVTAIPFQFLDDSKKIGFNVMHDDFQPNKYYPKSTSDEDRQLLANYLNSKDLLPTEVIDVFSESPARYIEMYRISSKPSSYDDFQNHLISRIDLKIKDSALTYADQIIPDEIRPNKKYYYLFRFVTENGMPGELSKVLECELVDDGGYLYSLFNVVEESDFVQDISTRNSTSFKKIMQLEPNMSQIIFDDTAVDYSKPAATQANALVIGDPDSPLFDKKFKIRLTSKKTGKKLDINVSFNIRTENYTLTPLSSEGS